MSSELKEIIWFSEEGSSDVGQLGDKNASLGETTRRTWVAGIPVPEGFGITAAAYWWFIDANRLRVSISHELAQLRKKAFLPHLQRCR
jgi:pyruvate, water dikinase